MTTAHPATLPKIKLDSVRQIVNDGLHNGFTDLIEFKGKLYVSFRSNPISHLVEPGSKAVVLESEDQGETWHRVNEFEIPARDVRDPHFLVYQGRLYSFSGSWELNGKGLMTEMIGHVVSSADGKNWTKPQTMEGTYGHYIWRAAAHGDKAYIIARWRKHVDIPGDPKGTSVAETALLESTDCVHWKKTAIIETTSGNETALLFEDDGQLTALVRHSTDSKIGRAKPPYQDWSFTGLGRFIGGPMISRWGKHILIGGRKLIAPQTPRTVLSWLVNDQLVDMLELPSGGDNSYTGFVPLSDTHGLVSYYSSHEGSGTRDAPAHIYLAKISLENV